MKTKKLCMITIIAILIFTIFLGGSVYASNDKENTNIESEEAKELPQGIKEETKNDGIALIAETTLTSGNFKYEIEDMTIDTTKIQAAVITGYTGNENTVTIPDTLRRKTSLRNRTISFC